MAYRTQTCLLCGNDEDSKELAKCSVCRKLVCAWCAPLDEQERPLCNWCRWGGADQDAPEEDDSSER